MMEICIISPSDERKVLTNQLRDGSKCGGWIVFRDNGDLKGKTNFLERFEVVLELEYFYLSKKCRDEKMLNLEKWQLDRITYEVL